jgi:hypothetical protein
MKKVFDFHANNDVKQELPRRKIMQIESKGVLTNNDSLRHQSA